MDADAVGRAVQSAAREAFAAGLRAALNRREAEAQKAQAIRYAEDLVLPIVKLAMDEAREQAWMSAKAADDAPGGGPRARIARNRPRSSLRPAAATSRPCC